MRWVTASFFILLILSVYLPSSYAPGKATSASHEGWWKYEDLVFLDSWGDSDSDARDIVAVYVKEESGEFYFRVDLLDLLSNSSLNVYLAVDYKDGGNTELAKDRLDLTSDISWDLLVVIYNSNRHAVFDADYVDHPTYLNHSKCESELDYIEFSILKEALAGWDGKPFKVQTFVTDSSSTTIVDKTASAATDATTGRAKLIITFGNMFAGYGPHAISWYDGFALGSEIRSGVRRGLKYLLDAMEKYELPLTTNDLRVDVLAAVEDLHVSDRLRDLANRKLFEALDTLTYGYFMPWQPKDVDARAISMARQYREALGLLQSKVFYPYEAMLTVEDLATIKEAGYEAIYGLDRYGYWFGWITDWSNATAVKEWFENARKIHVVNGLKVFFGNQGFTWDPRWGNLTYPSGYEMYNGTDRGLHLFWRRILLDMALDADQEKFFQIGTDLGLTAWMFQDAAEWNARWLANHPWIEVTTFTELLKRNWRAIDHGELGLAPDQPLERYQGKDDMHYNAYFWQFYYGGFSDGHSPLIPEGVEIEAYFDYVPYLRNGQKIPSGMKMGDDKTSGTIIYETLRNLRAAPNNTLTDLAWLSYFMNIGEQTLHAHTVYGVGGQYLHPAVKVKANHIREVNKILAAAQWADEVRRGLQPSITQVLSRDLDLDGEDEYIMKNDRVFAIFENDGGRMEYGFAYDPSVGPVELVSPIYQLGLDWRIDFENGEYPLTTTPETAFEEGEDYRYSIFDAMLEDGCLTFISLDHNIRKTFTLDGKTIYARYSTHNISQVTVWFGLPVNIANMFSRNWSLNVAKTSHDGSIGWKVTKGGIALVNLMETSLLDAASFADSPARLEIKERENYEGYPSGHWLFYPYSWVIVAGTGEFSVSLTLSAEVQCYLSIRTEPLNITTISGEGWYDFGTSITTGTAEDVIASATGTRYVFLEWIVDSVSQFGNPISIDMNTSHIAVAKYKTQYYLTVRSEYGSPQGGGWYDDRSTATFSVSSPVGIGIQQFFTGWTGDSTANTTTATIVVDGPKTVSANWRTDYTQAYAMVALIAAVITLTAIAMNRRRKR